MTQPTQPAQPIPTTSLGDSTVTVKLTWLQLSRLEYAMEVSIAGPWPVTAISEEQDTERRQLLAMLHIARLRAEHLYWKSRPRGI